MSIRRLPEDLINRIAAGEVVERPASVIKELVENSIDAGATHINIVTAGGGKTLMRIVDNGAGMNESDLCLAVERHATSKLAGDQLDDIHSLGFRGEALASIGSVASLSLKSRPHDAEIGLELEVNSGKISDVRPTPMNFGTVVEVQHLFEKIPARLKFLKGDRAETSAITDVVKRLAMANPGIHFVLEGADRQTSNWPEQSGNDAQKARLAQIIGPDFAVNSVSISNTRHGVTVTGMAGLPTLTRANSLMQFFFVNGRSVRDKVLIGAVRAAYSDFIFRGRFPVIALFINIDPGEVDVNVHPAKAELRFRDAGGVRSAVIAAIGMALGDAGYRASSHVAKNTLGAFQAPRTGGGFTPSERAVHSPFSGVHAPQNYDAAPPSFSGMSEPSARFDRPEEIDPQNSYPLGAARAQIFENYIVAQSDDALILIDQHAAHERLVYEKFKTEMALGKVASQTQLIPVVIDLPEEDCARLEIAFDALDKLGLGVERFGPRAMAVRHIPALLGKTDVIGLVKDIADGLAEWESSEALSERLEKIIGTMACHGSVRSGRLMKVEEMNALLRQMEATPHSGQCIHGRPTYVELKKDDIERLFGRS